MKATSQVVQPPAPSYFEADSNVNFARWTVEKGQVAWVAQQSKDIVGRIIIPHW